MPKTIAKNASGSAGGETQKRVPASGGGHGSMKSSGDRVSRSSAGKSKLSKASATSPTTSPSAGTPALAAARLAQQLPPSQGITTADAKRFREDLGLTVDDFAKLLGSTTRTVSGWEAHQTAMSPLAARVFLEVKALIDRLAALSDPSTFRGWLFGPNQTFGGSSPIQLIQNGQMYRLWELVFRIESGNPL